MELNLFDKFNRNFCRSKSKHIDADSKLIFPLWLLYEIAFKTDEAAAFDADFRSDTQTGGVDGHGHFGVTNHALEREHLRGWYHGEIGFTELVQACSVHHEMEDEGGVAGDGVTHFF